MTNTQIITRLREILATHNPCGFKSENGKVSCHGGTPCCHGCRHLTAGGCGLKDAHSCMFFFCRTAWAKMPIWLRIYIRTLGLRFTGKLYFRESSYSVISSPHTSTNGPFGFSGVRTNAKMMATKPPFIWS